MHNYDDFDDRMGLMATVIVHVGTMILLPICFVGFCVYRISGNIERRIREVTK